MQLAVTLGALYLILGVAATGGLLVCVATLPLNLVVMRRVKVLQDRLMKEKDERMALLSEALTLTLTLTLTLSLTLSLTLTRALDSEQAELFVNKRSEGMWKQAPH